VVRLGEGGLVFHVWIADVNFAKLIVIRYFTETLGMRYAGEDGDVLWFEDGLNKVAVKVYLDEVYEEAELYKRAGALLGLSAAKVYLAVLPDAVPFIDTRYFKGQGVGLVVVDPSRGPEGVDVKIFAKSRQIHAAAADASRLAETLRADLQSYIDEQMKRVESSLYERLKRYVDQRIEELRRPAAATPPSQPQTASRAEARQGAAQDRASSIVQNEWVRILRSKAGVQGA
jgi:hypothetical protein